MSWARALFEPKRVAVVGSIREGKLGRVLIDQLLDGGFTELVAVNPRGLGTHGVAAVSSFGELPAGSSPVDLAVIVSPAATVADVLEDAGEAGVQVAVIITAGFAESGDSPAEEQLLRIATQFGIRLIGPNCAGIVNTKHNLFPTLETRPPVGDAAFVSQSGALGGAVLSWAEEQGVGFSKFVSYGNGVDLTETDFLDVLREDEETRVVALYVETVSDGRRFMESARRLAASKPLIVIKSGRSDSGSRATLSHTGSMAGTDAVFDAVLRQCGAIRAGGIEEMFDLCRGFTMLPPVTGRRLAIITNSGGPGVLAADHAEICGLRVEPPSDKLRDRLKQRLEPFCSFDNPFDLTVQGTGDDYRDTLVDVLTEYDAALAINVNTPYLDSAPLAHGIVAAARETGKPIAASFMAGKPAQAALPVLSEAGVPNFQTGERAVRVLALLAAYSERQAALSTKTEATNVSGADSERLAALSPKAEATTVSGADSERLTALSPRAEATGASAVEPERERSPSAEKLPWDRRPLEPEAMDWLEELGFPVIERRWAKTADEAVQAAQGFEQPVAMKIVSPEIRHKTDIGGVALGLEAETELRAAFDRLCGLVAQDLFAGVLVTPMVPESVEMLVGLSRDLQFGPVIACGLGGIYTEILQDAALRVAPIDQREALAMIDELRGAAILCGVRGRAPRDLGALARLLVHVSELPFRFPEIGELDLNPVFLLERGLQIGDVRVIPVESPTTP